MRSGRGSSSAQDAFHPVGHDYEAGSPHLRHAELRALVGRLLGEAVEGLSLNRSNVVPHVLEVGAGHGPFTKTLLDLGCRVTVTEMSRASAEHLERVYASNGRVNVLYDPSGSLELPECEFDGVVAISVLHHIPDYLRSIEVWQKSLKEGGFFFSFQDPLLYQTLRPSERRAAQMAYSLWRLGQGNYRRGLATRMRRARGVIDPLRHEDMVEYHVVRDGVDSSAIERLLRKQFNKVGLGSYWATQARPAQRLGERYFTSHFWALALDKT